MAASTFGRGSSSRWKNCDRFAAVTVPFAVQLLSTSPGWTMASPIAARSLRARTWVLLRI